MRHQKPVSPKTDDEVAKAEAQIVELSKRIEFYLTEYSVELLANKMEREEFVVPSYQREFTWEPERKSKFIESLVLGLPIPFLFFWEMESGKLEIVDGSQRLRTIHEFVLGDFQIGELQSLTALSGFRFKDLPESRQRKVNNRSIRGIVLNEHADEQARFDLFERINTGSKIAGNAEVRRGALAGPFMQLIIELASFPKFVDLAPATKKARDERELEELVTRFFAYSDGLTEYRDNPSEFLFKYVKKMNSHISNDSEVSLQYRARFVEMVDFVSRVFPYGFRKGPTNKVTSRVRFEAIAIGSRLALDRRPQLASEEVPDVLSWLEEPQSVEEPLARTFTEVLRSDGANARARLEERINFVRDRLLSRE